MKRLIALPALVLAFAGCGDDEGGSGSVDLSEDCNRYQSGNATRVYIQGARAEEVCDEFAQNYAASDYWTSDPGASSGEATQSICTFEKEAIRITVFDVEGGAYGTGICADFQGAGWDEQ